MGRCGDHVGRCGDYVGRCGDHVGRCGDHVGRCGDHAHGMQVVMMGDSHTPPLLSSINGVLTPLDLPLLLPPLQVVHHLCAVDHTDHIYINVHQCTHTCVYMYMYVHLHVHVHVHL